MNIGINIVFLWVLKILPVDLANSPVVQLPTGPYGVAESIPLLLHGRDIVLEPNTCPSLCHCALHAQVHPGLMFVWNIEQCRSLGFSISVEN